MNDATRPSGLRPHSATSALSTDDFLWEDLSDCLEGDSNQSSL